MIRRPLTLSLLVLFSVSASAMASVEARLDRDHIDVTDSARLMLRVRGDDASQRPDLSPLERDFDVEDVQQTQRTSIVNGVRDESVDWSITLSPKRAGSISVPPLRVGRDHTDALSLAVDARDPTTPGRAGRNQLSGPARVDVIADTSEPYVQQPVSITVRLLLDDTVIEGALEELVVDGATVERSDTSEKDEIHSEWNNGREQRLLERHYVVIPQRSGALEIPAIRFSGQARAEPRSAPRSSQRRSLLDDFMGSGSPFDAFGHSPFGSGFDFPDIESMFERTERVQARSSPLTLSVRARPDDAGGATFLPARSVEVREDWSRDPTTLKVGESAVRIVTIEAEGLHSSQIPTIAEPRVKGLKLYPDRPALGSQGEAGALKSTWTQSTTVVPVEPGRFELPAIEIPWFDTQANAERVARLPATSVVADSPEGAVVASGADATPTPIASPEGGDPKPSSFPARPLAAISTLLLVAVAGIAWNRRSIRQVIASDSSSPPAPSTRRAWARFSAACQQNDVETMATSAVALGKAWFPDHPPATLAEFARRIEPSSASGALMELERARYAKESIDFDGNELRKILSGTRRRFDTNDDATLGVLPGLYPS